ncbi:MAG TPA: FMN-binding negative transcriptional regulator [Chitinophagaceae bacterium]|nr:FMN-binding negative transcriptional regulator [Chitinophagaceae bacterium]
MYNLPYFKEHDQDVVLQFMREHPFVFLSGVTEENKPAATQVPVFIDEKDGKLFLTGHIMRNTDHHKAFVKNPNVLAVFTGPHVYVSGTWYSDPHQASTWNYMSVHAKGILKFGNYDDLVAILKRLTLHYENNNPASTTVFDNLSSEYIVSLIKAIVAFEVEIMSVENVFKLSQNRDEKSYNNIISNLEEQGSDGQFIAKEMKKREQKLFGK